ncbi:MAG: SDR family NAD(P)-dependent oxidoreductase [Candidatus Lokiarchaeota archaeon]|nr:SDR family NAD(P)-dependent oxidoreductase [Candidatus Lokiarchaeota archaeon]
MKNLEKILVTGGCGFIGSHLVDRLIEDEYFVRVLDNLNPQVHGKNQNKPEYINSKAEYIFGDIREPELVKTAIKDIDIVFNLAAAVGVGQSMYQIKKYIDVNTHGTSNLLDVIINNENSIKKIIVASSMSIYGEGSYYCENENKEVFPPLRLIEDLKKHQWEVRCPDCNQVLKPIPTPEDKPLYSNSIYAQTKRHQEEITLLIGETYGIPSVALRFFNVYGSRQALSNPYTGVCAIFSSRILNNNNPIIFEDGKQTRDFIHISDIVDALKLSMKKSNANYNYYNVGTGNPISILEIAKLLINKMHKDLKPRINNQFRKGDIRHCYADISKIKKGIDFQPKFQFENGVDTMIKWVKSQSGVKDTLDKALEELNKKGLTID